MEGLRNNQINLDDKKSRDLYFKLGERNIYIGQRTFITVSLQKPALLGDLVTCEWSHYIVVEIEQEYPHEKRKGFTFQKLIIEREF